MAHRKLPQKWTIVGAVATAIIVRRNGSKNIVTISSVDVPIVEHYRWCIDGKGYVFTSWTSVPYLAMHRLITGVTKKFQVDHANHDPLDNRRCNLRSCTITQNLQNKMPNKNARVSKKGVFRRRNNKTNPYIAKILVNGKLVHLGKFKTAKEAAIAYDKAAIKHFGQFALTNSMLGLV